ncbi:unnamed protein product, partial [Rotaria sordida]
AYILSFKITNHILTHDWYLIGENHTHTTWGIWNPRQINNDSFYQETRGLNSLQILAFLLQTYAYSGDERFLNGANLLVKSHQYDVNLINQKTIAVCDNSFSDDELAYLFVLDSKCPMLYVYDSHQLNTSHELKYDL